MEKTPNKPEARVNKLRMRVNKLKTEVNKLSKSARRPRLCLRGNPRFFQSSETKRWRGAGRSSEKR
jgi:hypothetical protein